MYGSEDWYSDFLEINDFIEACGAKPATIPSDKKSIIERAMVKLGAWNSFSFFFSDLLKFIALYEKRIVDDESLGNAYSAYRDLKFLVNMSSSLVERAPPSLSKEETDIVLDTIEQLKYIWNIVRDCTVLRKEGFPTF